MFSGFIQIHAGARTGLLFRTDQCSGAAGPRWVHLSMTSGWLRVSATVNAAVSTCAWIFVWTVPDPGFTLRSGTAGRVVTVSHLGVRTSAPAAPCQLLLAPACGRPGGCEARSHLDLLPCCPVRVGVRRVPASHLYELLGNCARESLLARSLFQLFLLTVGF